MKTRIIALALATALLAALLPLPAQAGWTNDPYNGMAPVVSQPGQQLCGQMVRLSSGSYLFTWLEDNEYRTKYQILDAWGNQQFGPAGEYIIQGSWQFGRYAAFLIPDGEGGAIVVFSDNRDGENEIYGQRFDDQGNPLWGPTGLPLAFSPGAQDIIPYDVDYDDQGAFFTTWHIDGGWNNVDLYAQKFDLDGNPLWGDYGHPVSTAPGNQVYPRIVPDYQGGVILVWESGIGISYYLYTQHLDNQGNPLLQVNGAPVLSPYGTQIAVGGLEAAVPDGRGGGIWAFTTFGSDDYLRLFRLSGEVVAHPQVAWLWTSAYYVLTR